MPLTHPMKALETSCQLREGLLAELGLNSVLDVVAHTEAAFTTRFAHALPGEAAQTVHRTAQAARQQLLTLFNRSGLKSLTPPTLPATPRSEGDMPGSVFDANSPTWSSQFPEKTTVVMPGSIGDSSSPASYATSLYGMALQLEAILPTDEKRIKLTARRPDLGNTLLSEVAVNQPLPKLDIVNGTLQFGLQNSANNAALIKALQQQGVLPASITQLAYDTLLARLHYPGQALPYHEAHDQIVSSLSEQRTSLAALTRTVHAEAPAFCAADSDAAHSNRFLQHAASLSPALVSLVSAPPAFAKDATGAPAFLAYNLGVEKADTLNQLPAFTRATGLSIDSVLQLLGAAGLGAHNTAVVASANVPGLVAAAYNYGAVFIHGASAPSLEMVQAQTTDPISINGLSQGGAVLYDRYDRINRLFRLQRQTDLPFAQLDHLLVSAMRAEGANNKTLTLNTHSIRVLGFYQAWQTAYGLSAETLAVLLHQITPYAVGTAVPQFDRLFNGRTASGQNPLVLDDLQFDYTATEGADAVTVRQLCAGLKVSQAEFLLMAASINSALALPPARLVRSLAVVSALYRVAKVAALMHLRIAQLFSLLQLMPRGKLLLTQLCGVPQLAELDTDGQPKGADLLNDLLALADMVDWLNEQHLTVGDLLVLLAPPPAILPAGQTEVTLVSEINQHLDNVRVDINNLLNIGLPVADTAGAAVHWLALLSDKTAGVIDSFGLVSVEDCAARNQALATMISGLKLADGDKASALVLLQSLLDAALRSQQSLTDSQLSKLLGVAHGTVLAMLPCLNLASYTLLATCQAMNTPALRPADLAQSLLLAINNLTRYSLLARHYSLTPAALTVMSSLPKAFGADIGLNLNLPPVLADYVTWRRKTDKEDRVLQYLIDANGSPSPSPSQASSQLADILQAEAIEVQQAIDLITRSPAGSGIASTVPQIGHVMRLLDCAEQSGLSIALLASIAELDIAEIVLDDQATDDTSFANWRLAGLAVLSAHGAKQTRT